MGCFLNRPRRKVKNYSISEKQINSNNQEKINQRKNKITVFNAYITISNPCECEKYCRYLNDYVDFKSNFEEPLSQIISINKNNKLRNNLPELENSERNTSLNGLIRIPFYKINEHLMRMKNNDRLNSNELLHTYAEILELMRAPFEVYTCCGNKKMNRILLKFKSVMGRYNPNYSDYSQNDSLIFYNDFVNILISEYEKLLETPKQKINQLQESFYVDALKHSDFITKLINYYLLIRNVNIYDVLYCGIFLNEMRCSNCQMSTIQFENFTEIRLNTTSFVSDEIDLQYLLNDFLEDVYFKNEEEKLYCAYCDTINIDFLRRNIIRLPRILALSLEKINYETGLKEHSSIKSFDSLEIKMCNTVNSLQEEKINYLPFASFIHYGSRHSGHYISCSLVDNYGNNWMKYNDSSCSYTSKDLAIRDSSCILLYY